MGLPWAEEDNPVGAVAPQSCRGCLRGTQRGPRRPSHRLGRSLRLARLRPPRRSQQDQHRILLQRPGTLRSSRGLVLSHRFGSHSNTFVPLFFLFIENEYVNFVFVSLSKACYLLVPNS